MGQQDTKRTRRKFSDKIKRDAVASMIEMGPADRGSRGRAGLYDSTLGNWIRAARTAT